MVYTKDSANSSASPVSSLLDRKVTIEVDYIAAELTSNGLVDRGSHTVTAIGWVMAVQENRIYVGTLSGSTYVFYKTVDNNGEEVWANEDIGDGAQVVFHD